MNYTLTKISSPGFDLTTEHISIVANILDIYICDQCQHEYFPDNFNSLTDMQKVNIMISTACGCEFLLEIDNE